MWDVLGACVDDLDASAAAAVKLRVKGFLLHVAWHEGARLKARSQMSNRPARSFFQFEAFRAKEALAYSQKKGWLGQLATVAPHPGPHLMAAWGALPSLGYNHDSYYPSGNLIEDLLLSNDLFGAYLCRIAFKMVTGAIPASKEDQATYWYDNWKKTGGDSDALRKTFRREADEVDLLIPTLVKPRVARGERSNANRERPHKSEKRSGSDWPRN